MYLAIDDLTGNYHWSPVIREESVENAFQGGNSCMELNTRMHNTFVGVPNLHSSNEGFFFNILDYCNNIVLTWSPFEQTVSGVSDNSSIIPDIVKSPFLFNVIDYTGIRSRLKFTFWG